MLDRNQETRIKAKDVLKHKWITREETEEHKHKAHLSPINKKPVNKKANDKLSNVAKIYKTSLVLPVN